MGCEVASERGCLVLLAQDLAVAVEADPGLGALWPEHHAFGQFFLRFRDHAVQVFVQRVRGRLRLARVWFRGGGCLGPL